MSCLAPNGADIVLPFLGREALDHEQLFATRQIHGGDVVPQPRVVDRQAKVQAAAFAGGDAADHLRAVGDGLFGVEGALRAGEALADQAGAGVDEHGGGIDRGREALSGSAVGGHDCLRVLRTVATNVCNRFFQVANHFLRQFHACLIEAEDDGADPALDHVDHAAWSTYDNLWTFTYIANLSFNASTTIDSDNVCARHVLSVSSDITSDLHAQLACWCENERLHIAIVHIDPAE